MSGVVSDEGEEPQGYGVSSLIKVIEITRSEFNDALDKLTISRSLASKISLPDLPLMNQLRYQFRLENKRA